MTGSAIFKSGHEITWLELTHRRGALVVNFNVL